MNKGKCIYYRNCSGCTMKKKCKYVKADHHQCIHSGIIRNRSLAYELIGTTDYTIPNRQYL